VYRYGVATLAVLAGVLLIAVNAETARLIPLYAIGVFTGFTISQAGMVRHWHGQRTPRWQLRAALNGTGAVLTATRLAAGAGRRAHVQRRSEYPRMRRPCRRRVARGA
jgi:hypothetical protein